MALDAGQAYTLAAADAADLPAPYDASGLDRAESYTLQVATLAAGYTWSVAGQILDESGNAITDHLGDAITDGT